MVIPLYQTDPNTGKKTKTGEKQQPCDDCGAAGVVLKPSIQVLLSTVSKALLNPDPKIKDEVLVKLKTSAQEGFGRAAVNRLILADYLTSSANPLLEDMDKGRGEAVSFIANLGPTLKIDNRTYQWVKPYESNKWVLTYGADVRGAAAAPTPPPPSEGGPRWRQRWLEQQQQQQRQAARSQYVLVSGILEGVGLVADSGAKKFYQAPVLHAADIVTLRQ
jgi:hypothetical protein